MTRLRKAWALSIRLLSQNADNRSSRELILPSLTLPFPIRNDKVDGKGSAEASRRKTPREIIVVKNGTSELE